MIKKQTMFKKLWFFAAGAIITTTLAIVPNQVDNFEDGTTQGWGSGSPNPNPPANINTGGPTGNDDNYLRVTSNGGSGAGSRLVVINSNQWTGNYAGAGVKSISMQIKNFGSTTLSMRIALIGDGGEAWSMNPIILAPSTNWQPIVFSVQPADLTGAPILDSLLRILNNVYSFRILHSVAGGIRGDVVNAQIGLDNITALTQPVPVELISFSTYVSGKTIRLNWSTATETNNSHFDIQRKFDATEWKTIGSIKGNGTTTQIQHYSFSDDLRNSSSRKIFYRLKQVDLDGSFSYSNEINIDNNISSSFELEQNYPNPFNPSTKIRFNIPMIEKVKIEVFNAAGNKVATLLNGLKEAGSHEVQFVAENLASGVYFYKLSVGNLIQTKKMLLIR
jgi:hypothetical protein